jgi:hypothetical protein
LLSRLHRRAEALDSACLRALGHPHDSAIRQELLAALEWEESCEPSHARTVIRQTFKSVVDHSVELAHMLRHGNDAPVDADHPVVPRIEKLRASLARLTHTLATRHETPPKG